MIMRQTGDAAGIAGNGPSGARFHRPVDDWAVIHRTMAESDGYPQARGRIVRLSTIRGTRFRGRPHRTAASTGYPQSRGRIMRLSTGTTANRTVIHKWPARLWTDRPGHPQSINISTIFPDGDAAARRPGYGQAMDTTNMNIINGTRRTRTARATPTKAARPKTTRTERSERTTSWNAPPPAVVDLDMLPGRLALVQLVRSGIITPLDERSGYLTTLEHSVEGRARIAAALLPDDTMACMGLARWVWVGGPFPTTIDVISNSHFRADRHGRRVCAYKRRVPPAQRATIGELTLTSPARTVCDLGCHGAVGNADDDAWPTHLRSIIDRWQVRLAECRAMVKSHSRWPGRKEGLELFDAMIEAEAARMQAVMGPEEEPATGSAATRMAAMEPEAEAWPEAAAGAEAEMAAAREGSTAADGNSAASAAAKTTADGGTAAKMPHHDVDASAATARHGTATTHHRAEASAATTRGHATERGQADTTTKAAVWAESASGAGSEKSAGAHHATDTTDTENTGDTTDTGAGHAT